MRLCHVGMIVETSILLQGSEADVMAYCDALFAVRLPLQKELHARALPLPCSIPNPPKAHNPQKIVCSMPPEFRNSIFLEDSIA